MNIYDVFGLELTHIRYFVVLAEELHFGRAAQRLHISQPPLTQQIQRLESRIGCSLLRRTSRRVELTEAGRTFSECGRAILIEAERAVGLTRRVARGEGGALTLATAPSLMLDVLPRVILKFRRRFPSVDLRLREMATSRICDALQSGSVDLGLVRGPGIPDSLRKIASWKEAVVAILPRHHRLAKSSRFSLTKMAEEKFVFFPRELGPGLYDELIGFCRSAGFTPQITQEATQWSSILSLVRAGTGVSIGPASVRKLLGNAVVTRQLPKLYTEVHLLGTGRENPAASRFSEIWSSNSFS
jgi:DNA-binding transcriptional LysR family regulator